MKTIAQAPAVERPANRLLARLPAEDFDRLAPHLTTVRVRRKQVLHKEGERIRDVYFPNGGVYSVVSALSSGTMVETVSVGDEGMLGIEACWYTDAVAGGESVMQVPDTDAEMLSVQVLRREIARGGGLAALIGRYSRLVMAQLMQSVACLAAHHVRQRAARCLLAIGDRVGHDAFQLSHECLAVMLGASRPTVSEVAAAFQRGGLVRYSHGHLRVLDRARLEAESCECYGAVRAHLEWLRGGARPPVV